MLEKTSLSTLTLMIFSLLLIISQSVAQNSMEKSSTNNRVNTMTGGAFTLNSSIGQVSASNQQSGDKFSLNGVFWQAITNPTDDSIF